MTEQSNKQIVIKGISSQTLVTIVNGLVEIFSFSVMSRLLTKEDFGYYAVLVSVTTVFSSLSETGIGSAIIQKQNINNKYVNNAFTLSFIVGGILTLALCITAGPIATVVADSSVKIPLMLMSITLLCHCLTSVSNSLMQRDLKFITLGMIRLASLVITTIIAIILAIKDFGYYAILTKTILASILTLLLSLYFARTRYYFTYDFKVCRSIFGYSGWLMASAFFRNFAQQADRLLMSRLLSVATLGAYNRPKDFINQIASQFTTIFDVVLFPVLSNIQDKKESMQNAYISSFYYLNMFSMLLSLTFIFNTELLIRIFLGEQWLELATLFRILSVSVIFVVDGTIADCYFRSLALTKQQFYFRIIQFVLSLFGVLIGCFWNMTGIAISVVFVNFVMIIAKLIYLQGKVNISLYAISRTVLGSWRFTLYLFPLMVLLIYLTSNTLLGNVIVLFGWLIGVLIVFIVCPRMVGGLYYSQTYGILISYIKKFISKH